ncbi:Protein of unknown function DUF429 [Ferroglobus placidus DSM 10642]|uniref:DUF429 domain-containing protein n=1 Tax=Ferroglobus placidus (strain DSM 10642 / AEDII12DO) TaxID=589924 RepID=D3RX04_FERPA|nr:DUF429 domain-containing protein [Ferroglobus placidus]ADC65017.1 Protein of unknown function DUF429 [Ferroglobus placidus DSM 10642]
MICGIDVGIKESFVAVVEGRRIVYLGKLKDLPLCEAYGIDAPLSYEEPFRDCERELLKMGIPVIPLNTPFMKALHKKAVEIVEKIESRIIFEVYPYATRKLLGFAYSKKRKEDRKKIEESLKKFFDFEKELNEHEIDALTAALTVKLFFEGKAKEVGRKCKILIPSV